MKKFSEACLELWNNFGLKDLTLTVDENEDMQDPKNYDPSNYPILNKSGHDGQKKLFISETLFLSSVLLLAYEREKEKLKKDVLELEQKKTILRNTVVIYTGAAGPMLSHLRELGKNFPVCFHCYDPKIFKDPKFQQEDEAWKKNYGTNTTDTQSQFVFHQEFFNKEVAEKWKKFKNNNPQSIVIMINDNRSELHQNTVDSLTATMRHVMSLKISDKKKTIQKILVEELMQLQKDICHEWEQTILDDFKLGCGWAVIAQVDAVSNKCRMPWPARWQGNSEKIERMDGVPVVEAFNHPNSTEFRLYSGLNYKKETYTPKSKEITKNPFPSTRSESNNEAMVQPHLNFQSLWTMEGQPKQSDVEGLNLDSYSITETNIKQLETWFHTYNVKQDNDSTRSNEKKIVNFTKQILRKFFDSFEIQGEEVFKDLDWSRHENKHDEDNVKVEKLFGSYLKSKDEYEKKYETTLQQLQRKKIKMKNCTKITKEFQQHILRQIKNKNNYQEAVSNENQYEPPKAPVFFFKAVIEKKLMMLAYLFMQDSNKYDDQIMTLDKGTDIERWAYNSALAHILYYNEIPLKLIPKQLLPIWNSMNNIIGTILWQQPDANEEIPCFYPGTVCKYHSGLNDNQKKKFFQHKHWRIELYRTFCTFFANHRTLPSPPPPKLNEKNFQSWIEYYVNATTENDGSISYHLGNGNTFGKWPASRPFTNVCAEKGIFETLDAMYKADKKGFETGMNVRQKKDNNNMLGLVVYNAQQRFKKITPNDHFLMHDPLQDSRRKLELVCSILKEQNVLEQTLRDQHTNIHRETNLILCQKLKQVEKTMKGEKIFPKVLDDMLKKYSNLRKVSSVESGLTHTVFIGSRKLNVCKGCYNISSIATQSTKVE